MKYIFAFLLLLINQISIYSQIDLSNGLSLYYPFDGDATDESVNSYDGKINAADFTLDRLGNPSSAVDFSGGNKYIDAGNVMNDVFSQGNESFTISFWMNPSSESQSNNIILGKLSDEGCNENERQFVLRLFGDQNLSFTYYSELSQGHARRINSFLSLDDANQWYHVFVEYSASSNLNDGLDRVSMYVDCINVPTFLETSSGSLGDIQVGAAHLGIGNYLNVFGNACSSGTSFEGRLDELRIYNRVLSDDEKSLLCKGEEVNSLNSFDLMSDLKIHPNPINDFFYMDYSTEELIESIDLFDNTGKMLGVLIPNGNKVVMQSLADGIYFASFKNKDNQIVAVKKILKQ